MGEKRTIRVGNTPVTVVSDDEAETADYLVCVKDGPSPFTDNFKGVCCHCGTPIMYRWHAPRKPKKICVECFGPIAERERRRKGVTAETADETESRR